MFFKNIFFLTFLIVSQTVYSQLSIGGSFGFQIPGMQDLKFKQFDANNNLISTIKTKEVESNISSVKSLNVSFWLKKYGFKLEYLSWEHRSTAEEYLTQQTPSIFKTEESRKAIYLMALRRFPLPFSKEKNLFRYRKSYSFVGFGYGFARTEINYSLQKSTQPSLQLSYGISVILSKKLRANAEFKYLLAHDVDNHASILGDNTVIDTSGHWTLFRTGPHLDTKYHMFLFGLQYQLF